MSYKNEVKKIDGHDCSMNSLDFFSQMNLKRRLITPILKLIPDLVGGGMDSDIDFTKLAGILDMLDEGSQEELTRLVLKNCIVDGEELANEDIAGMVLSSNTVLFYKLIWFFLEVNYSDFLALIRTTLEKYGVTMGSMTEKLKASSQTMKKSIKKK